MAVSGSTTLLGRDHELAVLRGAFERAADGVGSVWLIHGDAGVGKTTLASQLVREAADSGAVTAMVTAWDHGGAPPFWPWSRLLRSLASAVGSDEARDTLASLVEALRGDAPLDDHDRFELFDEVLTALRNVAMSSPVVVLIDDLHAADRATLLLLRFVAQGVRDVPVLLLATYRPVELRARGDLDDRALSELVDAGRSGGTIGLDGLAAPEVGDLLTDVLGQSLPSSLVDRVHRLTDGNPLFVRYLAPQLNEIRDLDRFDVPDGIRAVIEERLDRVSSDERDLLRIASIVGMTVRRDLLSRLVRPATASGAWLDLAARLDLVTLEDEHVVFGHPLIREVLVDEVEPGRREVLHGLVADLLGSGGGAPDEVAHHLLRAGRARAAEGARVCVEAARSASTALAFEDATELLRQARRALDQIGGDGREIDHDIDRLRFEVLVELGRACWRAGLGQEGDAAFDEAWRIADELDDPDALAEAALGGGFSKAFTVSYPNERVTRCRVALERLGDGSPAVRSLLLSKLACELLGHPDQSLARQAALEALESARIIGDDRCLGEALAAVMVTDLGPDRGDRRELAGEMLTIARRQRDRALAVQARFQLVGALVEHGDRAELDAVVAAQHREVDELAEPRYLRHDVWFRAMLASVDGDLARAEELIDEGLAAANAANDPDGFIVWGGQLGVIRWMQGRVDELEPLYRDMAASSSEPVWAATLAWLWSRHGLLDAARGMLHRVVAHGIDVIPRDRHWLLTMSTTAEAVGRVGDVAVARDLRAALLPYEDRMVPIAMGISYWGTMARPLSFVDLALGDVDEAIRHLELAVASTARFGALPWMVEAQLDLAELLAEHPDVGGGWTKARSLVDEAAAVAQRLGLVELGDRAAALSARDPEVDRRGVGAGGVPFASGVDARPTVRVLGRFECVDVTGGEISWTSRKARSLLKMLVDARGSRVPRDALRERLWPDESSPAVSNRLAVAIATLRRSFDPGGQFERSAFVGADRDTVWIDVDRVDVDLVHFLDGAAAALHRGDASVASLAELQAAAGKYGGTAFADEPYVDWWTGSREQARAMYSELCHRIATTARGSGMDAVAEAALRDALDADPYDARAHRSLVDLHRARGAHGLADLAEERMRATLGELAP